MAILSSFKSGIINEKNFKPQSGDEAFLVRNGQFNDLIDKLDDDLQDFKFRTETHTASKRTTAAEGSETLTITDSNASSGDRVFASITSYGGTWSTNGLPVLGTAVCNDGSIDVELVNAHSANALSGEVDIEYMIVKEP